MLVPALDAAVFATVLIGSRVAMSAANVVDPSPALSPGALYNAGFFTGAMGTRVRMGLREFV